jgi:uncharacterized protein (TIGR00725 family)
MRRKKIIGVIGSGSCDDSVAEMASEIGRGIAQAGYGLVCGGLGGVMEAACRGASELGGLTIGILPGDSIETANPYVTVPIATGLGIARNIIIVRSARVLIAVSGGPGTLSEIAYALQLGVPIISLKSHTPSPEIIQASDPEHALREAFRIVENGAPEQP